MYDQIISEAFTFVLLRRGSYTDINIQFSKLIVRCPCESSQNIVKFVITYLCINDILNLKCFMFKKTDYINLDNLPQWKETFIFL